MPLITGAHLGPYEILSALGAGGMGEVYRARDGTLRRDVALKILPELFALDTDRLARFRREAQVLASLNHPNIAAIYGFEESTSVHALVLELVEGPTLADRIAQGPIPLDEALPIARQIAEALEAAHEHGVIHRDLKPANIKLRPDGTVKVLDFGLAKLTQPAAAAPGAAAEDVTASPTITSPAMMTGIGVILGTAAYMSPEQATGGAADKRSDIWAFGCVLYEMLTGRRAFDGGDITDILGAVVRLEPDWMALPSGVPPPVRTLMQGCLAKDRRARVADIGAALFILDHHASMAVGETTAPSLESLARRVAWIVATAAISTVLAGAAVWWLTRADSPTPVVTTIATWGTEALAVSNADRDLAITADGSRIVYRGDSQLFVRALDEMRPTMLSGLGAPHGVFISPDAQSVGFFDGVSRLARVAMTGGSPVPIAAVDGGGARGATWGADGTIIFATNLPATGLQRVSASGGEPVVLTIPDREGGEGDHLWPEFLPGGKAVLFTIMQPGGSIGNARVAVLDLVTGTWKVLFSGGSHAHYVPTGHLVYGAAGTLRAVGFDLRRMEVTGPPTPVLEDVITTARGAAEIAVAANGTLVYVPGEAGIGGRQAVVLVDRHGRPSPLPNLPLDSYRDVRVSPNGALLALATRDDILTYDITRAVVSRLTTDASGDRSPLWTPGGERIVYTSLRAGYPQLFSRPADGTGSDEPLLVRSKNLLSLRATGWVGDGSHLLFTEVEADIRSAIGQIAIEDPSEVKWLLKNGFYNDSGVVSPNGEWIAFESALSRRSEIYIARYPGLGDRRTISTSGGTRPFWSRDGSELFFGGLDNRQILAASVAFSPVLVTGTPRVLFDFPIVPIRGGPRPYDITPDGRFVIIQRDQAEATGSGASNMILVQNWFEELKRLVPTK
jgi:hypothetical protein